MSWVYTLHTTPFKKALSIIWEEIGNGLILKKDLTLGTIAEVIYSQDTEKLSDLKEKLENLRSVPQTPIRVGRVRNQDLREFSLDLPKKDVKQARRAENLNRQFLTVLAEKVGEIASQERGRKERGEIDWDESDISKLVNNAGEILFSLKEQRRRETDAEKRQEISEQIKEEEENLKIFRAQLERFKSRRKEVFESIKRFESLKNVPKSGQKIYATASNVSIEEMLDRVLINSSKYTKILNRLDSAKAEFTEKQQKILELLENESKNKFKTFDDSLKEYNSLMGRKTNEVPSASELESHLRRLKESEIKSRKINREYELFKDSIDDDLLVLLDSPGSVREAHVTILGLLNSIENNLSLREETRDAASNAKKMVSEFESLFEKFIEKEKQFDKVFPDRLLDSEKKNQVPNRLKRKPVKAGENQRPSNNYKKFINDIFQGARDYSSKGGILSNENAIIRILRDNPQAKLDMLKEIKKSPERAFRYNIVKPFSYPVLISGGLDLNNKEGNNIKKNAEKIKSFLSQKNNLLSDVQDYAEETFGIKQRLSGVDRSKTEKLLSDFVNTTNRQTQKGARVLRRSFNEKITLSEALNITGLTESLSDFKKDVEGLKNGSRYFIYVENDTVTDVIDRLNEIIPKIVDEGLDEEAYMEFVASAEEGELEDDETSRFNRKLEFAKEVNFKENEEVKELLEGLRSKEESIISQRDKYYDALIEKTDAFIKVLNTFNSEENAKRVFEKDNVSEMIRELTTMFETLRAKSEDAAQGEGTTIHEIIEDLLNSGDVEYDVDFNLGEVMTISAKFSRIIRLLQKVAQIMEKVVTQSEEREE